MCVLSLLLMYYFRIIYFIEQFCIEQLRQSIVIELLLQSYLLQRGRDIKRYFNKYMLLYAQKLKFICLDSLSLKQLKKR